MRNIALPFAVSDVLLLQSLVRQEYVIDTVLGQSRFADSLLGDGPGPGEFIVENVQVMTKP